MKAVATQGRLRTFCLGERRYRQLKHLTSLIAVMHSKYTGRPEDARAENPKLVVWEAEVARIRSLA